MDEHGYPTEDDLEQVRAFAGTPRELVELLTSLWNYPAAVKVTDVTDPWGKPRKRVEMVTMGWSGNEDVATALERTMFHVMWWNSSHRGGLTVYEVHSDQWDTPMAVVLDRVPDLGAPAGWVILQEHPDWHGPKRVFSRIDTDRAAAAELAESLRARPDPHGVTYRLAAVCPVDERPAAPPA